MAKYKIIKSATAIRVHPTEKLQKMSTKSSKSETRGGTLPQLSTKDYVFSAKAVEKKKKNVRHTLQCAENIMMQELGLTTSKKKRETNQFAIFSIVRKRINVWQNK